MLREASTNAARVDVIFLVLCLAAGLVMLALLVVVVAFAFRYRRGSKTNRPNLNPLTSREVEIGWTAATVFVFLFIFWWAASAQLSGFAAPRDAMEVHVVARQWMWKFQHPSGAREINDLHVPAMTPVRLVMISQDAIHSFFVPDFRMKQDVLPGRYTETWFEAKAPGEYRIACAEYCGTDHAVMTGRVIVLSQGDYGAWTAREGGAGLAARGHALYVDLGCSACHEPGSAPHAPSLKGLYGGRVSLERGPPATADEAYLRQSILQPNAAIVTGYAAEMPGYAGRVSEEDVSALIAWIRSEGVS
jgi:cytochrome c oxidase subunit 2